MRWACIAASGLHSPIYNSPMCMHNLFSHQSRRTMLFMRILEVHDMLEGVTKQDLVNHQLQSLMLYYVIQSFYFVMVKIEQMLLRLMQVNTLQKVHLRIFKILSKVEGGNIELEGEMEMYQNQHQFKVGLLVVLVVTSNQSIQTLTSMMQQKVKN